MNTKLFEDLEQGIDADWLRRTLQEMIQLRSENPFDNPPSPGFREKEMAEYMLDQMSNLGLEVESRPVQPDRPNVFGYLPGKDGDYTLMLAGHSDTALTTGYPNAYEERFEDGKVYGRGACDMKAALAAYLAVAKVLKDSNTQLKGNLILCANVDEEYQMLGSQAIGREGPRADQGIIGEPTSLQICPANKGRVSTKFITRGKAAHSSVPEEGVNAIANMAKIIHAFEDYPQELMGRSSHPLCGHGRFNIGVIQGGVQVNMVPDYCEVEVDRRTLPYEEKEEVYEEFHRQIRLLSDQDPHFLYEITEPTWLIPPNEIPNDSPVVLALRDAHLHIFGSDPGVHAFVAGSDAPHMGFPTVVCGPGSIAQAHTTNEFVDLDEVVAAAKLYLFTAIQLLD